MMCTTKSFRPAAISCSLVGILTMPSSPTPASSRSCHYSKWNHRQYASRWSTLNLALVSDDVSLCTADKLSILLVRVRLHQDFWAQHQGPGFAARTSSALRR